MSHISEFISQTNATPKHRNHDMTTAYECFTTAGKTGRLYRSTRKNYSRRVSYAADLVAGTEEEQNPQILSDLCRVPWRVFRVSPLWDVAYLDTCGQVVTDHTYSEEGLSYDKATFKKYARVIQGYVIKDQVNATDMPNKVELSQVKGLRGSRNDRDAIKITVTSNCGEESREVFVGVLCAIEAAELQIKSKKATSLPVFLTRGSVDVTDRVIFGLEKCFDCVVAPLVLPDSELSWMSAMWAGLEVKAASDHTDPPEQDENSQPNIPKKRGRPSKDKSKNQTSNSDNDKAKAASKPSNKTAPREEIKLGYVLPNDLCEDKEGKIQHLTVSLPSHQVKQLWEALHEEGEAEFTAQELEHFHKSLSLHLKNLFSIDFNKLKLARISLPFFQAQESGKIRVENEAHVKVVLRYLTELCQGNMLSADPTLSIGQTDNATMEWAN